MGVHDSSEQRPATYFWQEAALLAMGALPHRLDRQREGQPYFWLSLTANPPRLEHQSWDYCDMSGRWVDGLLLGRLMTGCTDYVETEDLLRRFLLARANPADGLFYNAEAPEFGSRRGADMFCQSRVLLGLLSWWQETGDTALEGYLERLVRGLSAVTAWDGATACYPATLWGSPEGTPRWLNLPGALAALDPKVAPALGAPGYWACQAGTLMAYHALSGSKAALQLAGGLVRHYLERSGAVEESGRYMGHTHSGGVLPTTAGILRYGLATGDDALVRWAQRIYDYTAGQAARFGWFPDGIGFPPGYFWGQFCETCALADYLELGILLSEAGLGDYWDEVERCARNQLLENQYRDVRGYLPPDTDPHVVAAALGTFECAARPNGLLGWSEGLEGCCIGSGLHALYLVWAHAVTEAGGTVTVNLPISRSTESLEVVGEEPYAGRVRLLARRPCTVDLRLPAHVDPRLARVAIGGHLVEGAVRGNRCHLPELDAGAEVVVTYPLVEKEEQETLAGVTYTARWKGATVLAIDPPGERYATYQRAGYRAAPAPPADRLFSAAARAGRLW
jgi:hypothetical protein